MSSDPPAHASRDEARGTASAQAAGPPLPARMALLAAMLAGVALAVTAFQAPNRTFVRFAAMDSGGELAIQDLIRRGSRPGVDFGYPYGLLPLLLGRAWYRLAGLSPRSYDVLVTGYLLFSCWGLARFAAGRRVGLAGVALIVLALPDLTLVTYVTSVHPLEQALLIHALAEQARGRRGSALAVLAACCFVKPSLAFVQGLAVLVAVVASARRVGRAGLTRALVPPLISAAAIAILLAAAFGPLSLARTLSPATGAAIYRANHFGFFLGIGRDFWDLPDASPRDYFRYEVGFWMLGTAFLAWGGLTGAIRLVRGAVSAERSRDDELIVTCATVHLAFVTLLFGHRGTWVYSLPMLILGLALLARRGPRHRAIVWVLAALLLVSDRSKAVAVHQRREAESPSPATLGLWSSPREREEWTRALELTRGQRPVLFAMCEGAAVLFPGFAPPVAGYVVPGCMLPVEVDRKAEQLAGASMIIAVHPPDWEGFALWPRLEAAFDGCELIFEGQSLRIYRREAPESVDPGGTATDPAEGGSPPRPLDAR